MPSLRIPTPIKGVNTVVSREGQPSETCWSATNVLPYDRFGRHRVAQRPGLVKQWTTQLGSTFVQGMLPINNITYAGTFTSTTGGTSTSLSTFANVPSGVVTSGNSITWPTNSTGYTPALSDTGPSWTGTVPSTAFTISFDVTMTGDSTAGPAFLWVTFNTTPHTFQNIFTSTRASLTWTIDPTPFSGGVEIQGRSNTGGGTKNLYLTDSPPVDPPFIGVPFTTTAEWSSTGDILPSVVGTSNLFGPPDSMNVALSSTANATVNFFAELPNNVGLEISNIQIVQGGGGSVTISTGQAGYQTLLIAVEGGYVWVGNTLAIAKAANGQPTPQLSSTNYVSMAYESGIVYIVDGSSTVHTYTIATDTVSTLTASTGTVGGGSTAFYNLICNWRGRIVLAGDSGSPQAYYMSRAGEPKDWNYASTDSAAAFAGQLGKAGLIGEPITALIPFTDDLLKIGCSHSMWMLQGDPADGGTITLVSNNMGIVGKDAWCVDPAGTLWFAATGGLFSVRPAWEFYRPPEAVSLHSVDQAFRSLNPGQQKVTLIYDPDLHYLHIFGTPVTQGAATHLTMDARSIGGDGPPAFWPQIFPDAAGPTAACIFFGDGNPNNRAILVGGFDGYIRDWNTTALDDDGSTISAGLTLGPFSPVPGETAIITGITLNMGEAPLQYGSTAWNTNAILSAGPSAYDVTEALPNSQNPYPTPTVSGLVIDRRQKTFRQRLRGGWFSVNLQNLTSSTFFSFESATVDFLPGGKERRQR